MKKASKTDVVVLFVQDTSELDYSSKKKTVGLGPIGDHYGRGLKIHSCLAVECDGYCKNILGLAHQKVWTRDNVVRKKIETRHGRLNRKNEGDLWEDCLKQITSMASSINKQWVSVGDRGNDIFSFIKFCKESSWHYLIRACQNRFIICEGNDHNKKFKLMDWARKLDSQATKTVMMSNQEEVELQVGWAKTKIRTPKNLISQDGYKEIEVYCIRCWNLEKNLEWILLTNLAVVDASDALEKIDWYTVRWTIEEYHKCLKTGCNIEKSNLQTAHALESLLGFLGIIAAKLLDLKFKSRENPFDPAMSFIDPLLLKIISLKFKISDEYMSLQQFWHCVAKLGGFIGRKSDGAPGWQTLWKGWLRLLDMSSGIELVQKCG